MLVDLQSRLHFLVGISSIDDAMKIANQVREKEE